MRARDDAAFLRVRTSGWFFKELWRGVGHRRGAFVPNLPHATNRTMRSLMASPRQMSNTIKLINAILPMRMDQSIPSRPKARRTPVTRVNMPCDIDAHPDETYQLCWRKAAPSSPLISTKVLLRLYWFLSLIEDRKGSLPPF